MTLLSVNINKVAVIRNSRGGNVPDLMRFAVDCESFGADGITVHPRPDERHIRYTDVYKLKDILTTELNVEGYPSESFLKMVCEIKPAQVTLVPDPPQAITSNAGWDVTGNKQFLSEVVSRLKSAGIRTSVFVGTELLNITEAKNIGADRIELYTEEYATRYEKNDLSVIDAYRTASLHAISIGLNVNAGHDLNLHNLKYFSQQIPGLSEVSIGHALISDALYLGIENTIQMYKRQLV